LTGVGLIVSTASAALYSPGVIDVDSHVQAGGEAKKKFQKPKESNVQSELHWQLFRQWKPLVLAVGVIVEVAGAGCGEAGICCAFPLWEFVVHRKAMNKRHYRCGDY